MKIIYDPNKGIAFKDGEVEGAVLQSFKDEKEYGPQWITVGTENFVHATRALVAEEKIKCEDVVFEFQGEEFKIDKFGGFIGLVPVGFCGCLSGLIGRRMKSVSKVPYPH